MFEVITFRFISLKVRDDIVNPNLEFAQDPEGSSQKIMVLLKAK